MAPIKFSTSATRFICQTCRNRLSNARPRTFTSAAARMAEDASPVSSLSQLGVQLGRDRSRNNLQDQRDHSRIERLTGALSNGQRETNPDTMFSDLIDNPGNQEKPHRLYIFSHRHNTHITLMQPPKSASEMLGARSFAASKSITQQKKMVDMVLSLSAGNIGFRKASRGSYDAGFQLTAFFLKQIAERGFLRDIKHLEVILRGFGAGREAATKVLLGTEGRHLKNRISAVVDATRLKHGGARSPKPRRLG